jgi:hypothetical protein
MQGQSTIYHGEDRVVGKSAGGVRPSLRSCPAAYTDAALGVERMDVDRPADSTAATHLRAEPLHESGHRATSIQGAVLVSYHAKFSLSHQTRILLFRSIK